MNSIKLILILPFVLLFFFGTVKSIDAATYYVAAHGNDSNPGTISQPFRTIQKGVNSTNTGDITYVRGGTYHEAITITKSGTSSSPMTISGYQDEQPIIDGQYSLPKLAEGEPRSWTPLVSIKGSNIIFSNFRVIRSTGRGIRVWPNNNIKVSNCVINNNARGGIIVLESDNVRVENCQVTASPNVYASDWPGAITIKWVKGGVVKGNTVHKNWGEGINVMDSENIIVEDNTFYNNFSVNLYSVRSLDVLIQKNIVYNSPESPTRQKGKRWVGIGASDEVHSAKGSNLRTQNLTIINNISVGNFGNFFWWGDTDRQTGLKNSLIAHNTFVNAKDYYNANTPYGISIDVGTHTGTRFHNNIILQDTGTVSNVPSGITFSNNLWSKTPEADAQGSGDIIANPKLVNANATLSPGNVDPNWYTLTSTSPAINSAVKLTEVFSDYFGAARGSNPDIGAHEYDGIPQLTITPTITHTPTLTHTPTPTAGGLPGDANGDEVVDIKDYSVWTNQYGDIPMPDPSGNADFNNDSQVNGQDYVIWLNNYSGHLLVEASYN